MKQGNVVLGVLAGITAGAMLGILFAPDKGSKTRKHILNKGQDISDDLQDKYDEFVETMADKYDSAKKEVEDLIAMGQHKIDSAKNGMKTPVV